jgi:hypothetical protein
MKIDYEKLIEICKKEGCYCPKEYEVRISEAKTPMWLRLWFGIRYMR